VESVKAVSDIYAPVSGEVVAVNHALADKPEKLNLDPHGEGWLVKIKLSAPDEIGSLMSAADYEAYGADLAAYNPVLAAYNAQMKVSRPSPNSFISPAHPRISTISRTEWHLATRGTLSSCRCSQRLPRTCMLSHTSMPISRCLRGRTGSRQRRRRSVRS
jgi:hypothetical protein